MLLLYGPVAGRAQSPQGVMSQPSVAECPTIVTVTGAVNLRARFELRRRVRLFELLAYAGGPTDSAGQTVRVEHSASACEKTTPAGSAIRPAEVYKLTDVSSGDEKFNPYLQGGDVVNVTVAETVYVVGNVVTPQGIRLKEPLTLTGALAMAGGVLPDSRTERVAIHRQVDGQPMQLIYVNLKEVKRHRAEDLLLQPYDIIEVKPKRPKGISGPQVYREPLVIRQDYNPSPLRVIQ